MIFITLMSFNAIALGGAERRRFTKGFLLLVVPFF
jgi:hypothetical protein